MLRAHHCGPGWPSLNSSPPRIGLSVFPPVCMILEGRTDLFIPRPSAPMPNLAQEGAQASSSRGPKLQLLLSGKGSRKIGKTHLSHDFKLGRYPPSVFLESPKPTVARYTPLLLPAEPRLFRSRGLVTASHRDPGQGTRSQLPTGIPVKGTSHSCLQGCRSRDLITAGHRESHPSTRHRDKL